MKPNPTPLNPRHARMLAQAAFEDAADGARDGNIDEAISRAREGLQTLLDLSEGHHYTFPNNVREIAA